MKTKKLLVLALSTFSILSISGNVRPKPNNINSSNIVMRANRNIKKANNERLNYFCQQNTSLNYDIFECEGATGDYDISVVPGASSTNGYLYILFYGIDVNLKNEFSYSASGIEYKELNSKVQYFKIPTSQASMQSVAKRYTRDNSHGNISPYHWDEEIEHHERDLESCRYIFFLYSSYERVESLETPELVGEENYRYIVSTNVRFSSGDIQGPGISGRTSFTTSVDNPLTLEAIRSGITAIDETDGDVSSTITLKSDGYSANRFKVGTYYIVYTAHDKAGNEAELRISVTVQDLVKPTLEGPSKLERPYNQVLTDDDILVNFTASDNYDKNISPYIVSRTDAVVTKRVNDSMYVGYQDLVIGVKDSSNHLVTKDLRITYKDTVAPTISGSKTFVTNNQTGATIQNIIDTCKISASDEVDGTLTFGTDNFYISNNTLTGNANVTGEYVVSFTAKDSAGNTSTLDVSVTVLDKIPPVFYIDESIIYASKDLQMTSADLVNLMVANLEIKEKKAYKLSLDDVDGYLEQAKVGKVDVGNYTIVADVRYEDGEEDEFKKTIVVYDELESTTETVRQTKNWWECFKQFFVNCHEFFWSKLFTGKWNEIDFVAIFTENYTELVTKTKE